MAANGRLGQFDLVLMWAEEALAATPAPGSESALVAALAPSAQHMIYAGNHQGAARLTAEIDRIVAAAPSIEPGAAGRVHLMRAIRADHEGENEAGLASLRAALASFEEAGDRRNIAHTLSNLGFALATVGAYAEAEEALRRAHANAERMGLGVIAPFALHNLGGVLHHLGRLEEARAVEAEAVQAFERARDPRLEGAARVYLARILHTMGDLAGAEAEARHVAELPASTQPVRAGALGAMAAARLAQGRTADALASATEAHAMLVSLGAIEDFDTLIRVIYAEALHAAGDADAARTAIVEARRSIHARAARMSEEGRARFLTAVPDNARCMSLAEGWGVRD